MKRNIIQHRDTHIFARKTKNPCYATDFMIFFSKNIFRLLLLWILTGCCCRLVGWLVILHSKTKITWIIPITNADADTLFYFRFLLFSIVFKPFFFSNVCRWLLFWEKFFFSNRLGNKESMWMLMMKIDRFDTQWWWSSLGPHTIYKQKFSTFHQFVVVLVWSMFFFLPKIRTKSKNYVIIIHINK